MEPLIPDGLRALLFPASDVMKQRFSLFALVALTVAWPHVVVAAPERPNILVVYAEDISTELGCYGYEPVHTPELDRFAREGERFTAMFTTTPVCSTSRTSMFTGMYPTRIGAQNHRTFEPNPLPAPVRPISALFREAGYVALNFGGKQRDKETGEKLPVGAAGSGKTDLNFAYDEPLFDQAKVGWEHVPQDRPWIGWLSLQESHKGYGWPLAREVLSDLVDPAAVKLPPYWPDHPVARDEFANYLDAVSLIDRYFGEVLANLEATGQAERTVVLFIGDNGRCLFRGKQFLYDPGIHVPMIIRYPQGRKAGTTNDDFVTGIDVPGILLGLAGLPVPEWMEGRDLLDPDVERREYVVTVRDRCDMAIERMRAVRDRRFKYIRNFLPAIPYMQWNPYKEREYATWNLIKELQSKGRLNPVQARFAAAHKPMEELYDLANDPDEINNLALDPAHAETLAQMRNRLEGWLAEGPDYGATLEDPLHMFPLYFGRDRLPQDFGDFQPIYKN